jgi:YhcH/YjgK/YiaL family protein
MLIDHLSRTDLYRGLGPRFAQTFDFLRSTDLRKLPLGKHELAGDKLFALVQEYTPKPRSVGKFEAHERYWDIQCVAQGAERMGWVDRAHLTVSEPHDAQKDIAFFHSPEAGPGEFLVLSAGYFMVLGPNDAHMPGVAVGETTDESNVVRKIVIKVDPAS